MPALTQLLVQFLFRLTFGLALSMAFTSPRQVTSGYYRVHLWVLLGLNTLAALAMYSDATAPHRNGVIVVSIVLALLSYVGAIVWLYERAKIGIGLLATIAVLGLVAGALAQHWPQKLDALVVALQLLDIATGGLVLGAIMAAMLLGHWYLNTPTMQLAPLKRLVLLIVAAVIVRAVVAGVGLALNLSAGIEFNTTRWIFVVLRWTSGIVGTGGLTLATWQVLKIPNTQSATGILYAAVILSFIGELTSQLLSVELAYPV